MSWLFSQALVEEYLGDICSDGELSVQSSGSPTQQAYCAPDKMTDFSRLSRFGMMFKPLTGDLGEAVLMSYLAGFPARTLVPQGEGQVLPENDQECGFTWPGSWAKYDHVSCSWKTRQCSLLGGLEPFSETWPRWGTMQNGEFWELPTLAHRTSETESGLWPTPTVCGNYNRKGASANSGDGLATAVAKWPTPTARIWKGGGQQMTRKDGKQRTDMLDWLVEQNGGRLNPMWVEWLMGWPLGWTDLKPLETDKFQRWQEEHGSN